MMRRLRTFEKQIDQFNKEAKDARQPSIQIPEELDLSDLSKVPSMDELEVCSTFPSKTHFTEQV